MCPTLTKSFQNNRVLKIMATCETYMTGRQRRISVVENLQRYDCVFMDLKNRHNQLSLDKFFNSFFFTN